MGIDPGMPDDLDRPEGTNPAKQDTPRTYGDSADPGELLTLDEGVDSGPDHAAARLVVKMWRSQDQRFNRSIVEGVVNECRRNGEVNVRAVEKVQDQGIWKVWRLPGSGGPPVNVLNKADRLCERLCSTVYSDEPKMEATPDNGTPQARDAADLATRLLKDVDSEGVLDDLEAHKTAFDYASSWGSGYIRYYLDPKGGGRHPVTIEASPAATHVNNATHAPIFEEASGQTTMQPQPGPLQRRHVMTDGQLTDDPNQAAMRWMPQLCSEVYTAASIRLWPPTARNLWDAEGLVCGSYETLSQLQTQYEELRDLDEEMVQKLTTTRIANTDYLKPLRNGRPYDPQTEIIKDRLVFHALVYFAECPSYPDGAYLCVVGDSFLVRRGTWVYQGKQGRERKDIPFTQVRQFRGERGNPHGKGLMHIFGPASEWRAELVGAVEDLIDQIRSRKTFIPSHSNIQPKQWLLPGRTMITVAPGGVPTFEDIPTDVMMPASKLFQIATDEMDDASTMQQTAQGLETSDAQSGKAKSLVLSTVRTGQSDILGFAKSALVRAARIKQQLLREIPIPQLVKYVGDDGEYKVKAWTGTDLRSTRDVRIAAGSMTMMSPAEKAQTAMNYATQFPGLLNADDLRDALFDEISPQMGWQDNPHVMRARQQLAKWEEGPPQSDGMTPPPPPQPAGGFQTPMQPDPMTSQAVPVPGAPPQPMGPMVDPRAQAIFDVRPVDSQQDVALIRAREIGRAMAGFRYAEFPPEWRAALDVAYQAAMQAAHPPQPVMQSRSAGEPPMHSQPQKAQQEQPQPTGP